ncbi:MAG: mechanosensitive ion channel [Bacteroidales bacterium]|nr:mechanosensitive ion channel [Bacteroidales bacterium]
MVDLDKYGQQLIDMVLAYGPKLITAIVVLVIGLWVIRWISKFFLKFLEKRNIDASLRPFLKTLISTLLKAMLIISVMGMAGIEMTSFIAILGAAGLAIGLALSGTLQNFAGGVMILLFKPYKVGDYVDLQGYSGTVSEIQIFNTILKTPDNKVIIIPNSGISTSSMVNYSSEPTRRVDWSFGIAYGDNLEHAKGIIRKLLEKDSRVLTDPGVFVALGSLADSSVNITVRAWVKAPDYWDVFFQLNENVYYTFNAEGISIPFPQMDVHVHNQK